MQNDIIAISTYSAKDEKPNRVKFFNFIINDEDENQNKNTESMEQIETSVY